MCANDHKKPQERKDNVTVGGKMSNLPFFIKWQNKSILYSRGHCSGEEKEKKEKKREKPSWPALKAATPDKHLAQEKS